ncbi:MAG: hypothetical protein JWM34_2321 [Ilumatobacteraceae bacterium]|nr:hypothetical protein [Ilumatobacteraceae bacterium]
MGFQLLYGTHDVGLVEEWGINELFSVRGTVFWTPSAPPGLAAQSIRPFTVVPHSIAFLLDPNSYVWYHLLNACALGLKGLAMLSLLVNLGIRRSVAIGGAIVFALFPAWTGLFTFRMIHAEFAVAALVFAVAQLIAYSRAPSVARAVAIGVGLGISLLLYEVSYIAVALIPSLLFVNAKLSPKQFFQRAAVWFAVPFVNGLRIILLLRSGQTTYEENVLDTSTRHPRDELIAFLKLIYRGGFDGFVHGPMGMSWSVGVTALVVVAIAATLVALRIDAQPAAELTTAQLAIAELLSTGAVEQQTDGADVTQLDEPPASVRPEPILSCSAHPTDRRLLALAAGALVSAPLVTLIYAPNRSFLTDSLRVFSIASLPLSLALMAAVELLARHSRVAGPLAVAALVASTGAAASGQRDEWHDRSTYQEHLLGSVVEASLDAPAARTIIVIDPERLVGGVNGNDAYDFLPEIFPVAVAFAEPRITQVLVCHGPIDELPATSPVPRECVLNDGVVSTDVGSMPVAGAAVIEIRKSPSPRWPSSYLPLPTHRARALLHCVAAESCDDGSEGIEARFIAIGSS